MIRRLKRRLGHARKRYQEFTSQFPTVELRLCTALRAAFARGYGLDQLRRDLLAGMTVGIVALPLSMALAIAVGVPPQYGLYTAIFGGGLAAIFSGSATQVTGPTAAFVVILTPIVARYGLSGLLLATFMAGLILVLLGLLRFGRLIQYIPTPVTTGFTAGIATVIAVLQIKDLLGLRIEEMPEHFLERVAAIWRALPSISFVELGVGLFTLAVLVFWPRISRRIPSPLVALLLASLAGLLITGLWPQIELRTIGNCFSYLLGDVEMPGIPRMLPMPQFPWLGGNTDVGGVISLDVLRSLLPAAFTIALLGAIESLLSATVADGMAGTRHDPDGELVSQGAANIVAPFFGGFAATGALARTATNLRAGAVSPLAAFFHALFVLTAMLTLAPALSHVPMAAFAALLLVVAWNMSDLHSFVHIARVAPKSDVAVMLTCLVLTVVFDMVTAVSAGIVLAALLFIRRMVEISDAGFVGETHHKLEQPLPPGVLIYEIAGPLFFGAANKAMLALGAISKTVNVLIIDVRGVPAMDATGLVNLENVLEVLHANDTLVIMVGVQAQPLRLLEKAEIRDEEGVLEFAESIETALLRANQFICATNMSPATP